MPVNFDRPLSGFQYAALKSSQRRKAFLRRGVGIGALLLLSATAAYAQTKKNDENSNEAGSEPVLTLETITITGKGDRLGSGPNLTRRSDAGSRLDLTPLETPASVEILSGDKIRERGQIDIDQAIVQTGTGINFMGSAGNGGTALGMRGFTGHGSVTRLYDGTRLYPASGTITFPYDSWTVDRIEILHGPASVLYGEGAIGGAINIIPNKPLTDGYRNDVQAMIGTDGLKGLAYSSAGPINQDLAYNFDISGRGTDGWMDRGDAKSLAISGGLLWTVNEDLKLSFSHDYGYNKPTTYFGTPLIDGVLDKDLRRRNYNVEDALVRFKDQFTQVKAEWTPSENISVRSNSYYLTSDRDWRNVESFRYQGATNNIGRSDYIAIHHAHEQIGHRSDVTLSSTLAGIENETVLGFDLNHIRFKNANNSPYPGSSTTDIGGLEPGQFGPYVLNTTTDTTTEQYSLFADNRLMLNEQWSLIGGVRFDSPHVTRKEPSFEKRFNSLNWRVGAVYSPLPDLAFFVQYSKAAEPIGNILSLAASQKDYSLPKGEQFEAGVKAAFFDGRLEATLSAYHITKKDMLARDPDDRTIIRQIGQQSSKGVEAAIGIDLWDGWTLNANGTVLSARFDDYQQSAGDFTGNTPPNVPLYAANIFGTWNFAQDWMVHGGVHHVGRTYSNDANSATRPSYSIVNAGLQWKPTDTASIDLNVYNIFDETYATSGGSTQWMLGPPRSAMLSMRYSF